MKTFLLNQKVKHKPTGEIWFIDAPGKLPDDERNFYCVYNERIYYNENGYKIYHRFSTAYPENELDHY